MELKVETLIAIKERWDKDLDWGLCMSAKWAYISPEQREEFDTYLVANGPKPLWSATRKTTTPNHDEKWMWKPNTKPARNKWLDKHIKILQDV